MVQQVYFFKAKTVGRSPQHFIFVFIKEKEILYKGEQTVLNYKHLTRNKKQTEGHL